MKIIDLEKGKTFHVEARRSISYKDYTNEANRKEDKGKAIAEILDGKEAWFFNPKDDVSFCIISYWDENDVIQHIVLFSAAKLYIMQNGKTIDSINI